LDLTTSTYKERGRPARESHAASLKAELVTAARGINPITLDKPASRRHEMQNAIAFRVLQALEADLRGSFDEAAATLRQAEDLVEQILLAGIQKGMISDADIRDAMTQEAIDALWRAVAADAAHRAQFLSQRIEAAASRTRTRHECRPFGDGEFATLPETILLPPRNLTGGTPRSSSGGGVHRHTRSSQFHAKHRNLVDDHPGGRLRA
jgi:hypothetical protein